MQCNFVIKGLVSLFVVLFGSLVGTVDWINNILVEKIWHVTFFRKYVILEHEWWNTSQLTAKIAESDTVERQSVGNWHI